MGGNRKKRQYKFTVLTNFIGVGQMDAFELIKMFAALMLSQTHY